MNAATYTTEDLSPVGAMLGVAIGSPSPMFVGAREQRNIWYLLKVVPKTALYIPPRLRRPLSRWRASGWIPMSRLAPQAKISLSS
jgi:hypothetical protein